MWLLSHPLVLFILQFLLLISLAKSEKLMMKKKRPFNNTISAILVFGDSTVDSGNNNYVDTFLKSNFPPYGMGFLNRTPTGRFSDGRLVTDFIASYVGIKEYIPPYLDSELSLEELMTGVSFASAGSGYDPLTTQLSGVIPLQKQLEYFKEYKRKLEVAIGKKKTKTLIRKAAFLISAGTNDIVFNYVETLLRRQTYNVTTYEQFLLQNAQQFIQGLRKEGARLIAMVGLPPIGCVPIIITLTSGDPFGRRRCTDFLSSIAVDYNQKLKNMLTAMQNSSSRIVYADIYKSFRDMIRKPSQYGFDKVNAGCCGSGLVEMGFMCHERAIICENPSKYVFFDAIHPTEATYNHLFKSLRPTIDRVIKNSMLITH